MFRLDGKNAVVTGGASGIGLEVCHALAKAGAHVFLLDLNMQAAKTAAVNINAQKYNKNRSNVCTALECNVAVENSVVSCFKNIDDHLRKNNQRLDILINNAGISAIGTVEQCTVQEMQRVYNVNVLGVFLCTKSAVKRMLKDNRGGAIVNLASIASVIGLADRFAYSMTKGAVLTMTYSVATDYVKKGIRCNAVCPARVHTPFVDAYLKKTYPGKEQEMFKKLSAYQPIGRMGSPKEIAALILYLCTDEAGFVTGAAYPIDGGVTARM
eukprot:g2787.t1